MPKNVLRQYSKLKFLSICQRKVDDSIEDTEHLFLLCLTFDGLRRDLLAEIVELLRPFVQITDLSNDALTQLLLYGDQDLSYDLNKNILELTLRFIRETGSFD